MKELDELEEEFDDRFGEPPEELSILLRMTRLQIAAGRLGLVRVDAGPKALAVTLTTKTPAKAITALSKKADAVRQGDRLIFSRTTSTGLERLSFFEALLPRR